MSEEKVKNRVDFLYDAVVGTGIFMRCKILYSFDIVDAFCQHIGEIWNKKSEARNEQCKDR